MKNKLLLKALLSILLCLGLNVSGEDFKFSTIATGNTTGYIGDLIITNKTSQLKNFTIQDYVIPSKNDKQGFVVLNKDAEKVEILAGESHTYQLYGYCINVALLPPKDGELLADFSKWYLKEKFDDKEAQKWKYASGKPKTINFKTQMPVAAPLIVDAVNKLEERYNMQRITLEIPDLYPGNSLILKEALIQQAIWQFTSTIQGKTYTFGDFEQSILKQEEIKNWLKINGTDDEVVDNKSFSKKNYFNFQCQKLWNIVTQLNLTANPKIKNVIPEWDIVTGNLNPKFIRFQYNWRDIALTGYNFKPEEVEKKKMWPYYVAGGVAVAGITTAAILLTKGKKGCTDPTACNYNEEAKKDDGSCEFISGCMDAMACNYNPDACNEDNNSCIAAPCNETDCDLKQGIIRFNECGTGFSRNCFAPFPYYLIEYNGELYDPLFDLVEYCINGFEGQSVLFDFNVIPADQIDPDDVTCLDTATPIYLTCLEIDTEECTKELVTLEVENCDCDESERTFLKKEDGTLLEFYFSDRCKSQSFESGNAYYVDYGISNFEPNCSIAKELAFVTCMEKACPDPCDPACLKIGTIRYNENCMTDIIRTCTQIPHYLIEYNGELLSPILNRKNIGEGCFVGYEGQQVLFNFTEVPDSEVNASYVCADIATPIDITCFQTIKGNCNSEQVEVVAFNCSCNGNRTAFFENSIGETLLFLETNCATAGVPFYVGDVYNVDYFDAVTQPGCDVADKTVVLTCLEKVIVLKTDEDEPETNSNALKNLTPYIENSIVSIPIQKSEYLDEQLVTTILGINYYKPLTPTIFIQNQTVVGNVFSSNLYFLNNKTTINAKNPYLPIHYGFGLNNRQLTDFITTRNWETDVIWNVGFTLTIFKKLQIQSEVFKTFNVEDKPNVSLRLIYGQSKEVKEKPKSVKGLKF